MHICDISAGGVSMLRVQDQALSGSKGEWKGLLTLAVRSLCLLMILHPSSCTTSHDRLVLLGNNCVNSDADGALLG